jgi:uncharacterized delta-60 repeat protein
MAVDLVNQYILETKKNILVCCLCLSISLLISLHSFAQPAAQMGCWTFGGTNYDYGQSVQQTSEGGYVVAGYSYLFGSSDLYVVKWNADGTVQWKTSVGGTNWDAGYSIQQTNDGGYIIGGSTYTPGSDYDIYVVKLDGLGNLQWTKIIGGLGIDACNSVQQTSDGVYILGGHTASFGPNKADFYIVKLNASGTLIWTKTIGGTSWDYGHSIQQTSDGGYVIGGYTLSFGVVNYDVYVVKLDSLGNLQWTKTIGGNGDDRGYSVQQTSDGGYVLTGYTASFGAGNNDVYVIKLNSFGNLQWTKTIGGANADQGNSIHQTTDTGYVITGYTTSFGAGNNDVYLIKLDASGNLQWTKTIGGANADQGNSIKQISDGSYIIGGSTTSFGAGTSDVYFIKLDTSGNTCCTTGNGGTISSGGNVSSGGVSGSGGNVSTGGTAKSGGVLNVNCFIPSLITGVQVQSIRCYGDSNAIAMVTASGGTPPYTYTWTPTGINSATATGLAAGIYTIVVADAGSTVSSATINITQPPPVSLTPVATPSAICLGNASTISANASGGTSPYTYTWQPGNLSGATQTVYPNSQTIYTITVEDVNNCVGTGVTTVTVNPLPTITAGTSNSIICVGQTATISASGANTYTWSPVGSGSNIVVTPSVNTVYTVSGTDANGCVNSSTKSVTVNPLPVVTANTSATIICGPPYQGSATITASGASTYTWNTSATTTAIAVSPSITTVYTVTGTDANGCLNSTSFTQSVSACTGISATLNDRTEFEVFPNPTSGIINVHAKAGLQIHVYNIVGELILSTELKTSTTELDLSNHANGVYFIRIGWVTKKIIKE